MFIINFFTLIALMLLSYLAGLLTPTVRSFVKRKKNTASADHDQ